MYKTGISYLFCILICLTVGVTAGYATIVDSWYQQLIKASFNPPNWVFAPVWTVLYVLMGIAWGRILTANNASRDYQVLANRFFIIQLFFNFTWSFVFFKFHLIALAWLNIWILWAALLICIIYTWRVSKFAALLLMIYICWVSFANILNGMIWHLN